MAVEIVFREGTAYLVPAAVHRPLLEIPGLGGGKPVRLAGDLSGVLVAPDRPGAPGRRTRSGAGYRAAVTTPEDPKEGIRGWLLGLVIMLAVDWVERVLGVLLFAAFGLSLLPVLTFVMGEPGRTVAALLVGGTCAVLAVVAFFRWSPVWQLVTGLGVVVVSGATTVAVF